MCKVHIMSETNQCTVVGFTCLGGDREAKSPPNHWGLTPSKKLVKPILFQHFRFNRWMEGSRGMAGTQSHCITIHIIARYF